MGLQCAELAGILMTSRNTPPFSSLKSAYANGPWIQFKGVSFKWGLYTSTLGAVRESDIRKVRDTCLFFFILTEHDPVSMHLCRLLAWYGLLSPSIQGGRERVNPANCDCVFKMWCSAGGWWLAEGGAAPIQVHAPVWKRGERLWGSKLKE